MAKKKKSTIKKVVETVEGWVGMGPAAPKKPTKKKPTKKKAAKKGKKAATKKGKKKAAKKKKK